ncbi:MAG: Ig-like domain-containing protein [Gemmatimonadota bacterium]|nr:Ig-like domain-containing protein [Gemmatimonadota bacterium]
MHVERSAIFIRFPGLLPYIKLSLAIVSLNRWVGGSAMTCLMTVAAGATAAITVTTAESTPPANSPPEFSVPGDKTYEQGETIIAIDFKVTDEDGDEVTTTVSGLPSGLSYTNSLVQGTVSASATAQDYTVTVSADDGVNAAVTGSFTITVTAAVAVTLSGPTNVQNGEYDVTVTFSEGVSGFRQGDVTVGNGSVTAFSGLESTYTATVTPTASGTVTVDVPANVATGAAGNGNEAAGQFSVMADLDAPTVGITGPAAAQNGPFDATIAFSEDVTGFEQGDVTVGNGTETAFSGSGDTYTATITPASSGMVTVDVAANAATDAVGNGYTAADRFLATASLEVSNSGLEIIEPGDKTYTQGETITSFGIPVIHVGGGESPGGAKRAFSNTGTVTAPNGDLPTVTVGGLPSGLSYTSRKVQGTVSADATVETYTVAINAANVNGQLDDATFRITVTAASEVTVSDATAVEGEALSFMVRLAKAVQGGLTVTPVFSDVTAKSGDDYTENTSALGFIGTAGEERTFTVSTIEDEVVEDVETFTLRLVVSDAPSGVSAGNATGTITDDDGSRAAPGKLGLWGMLGFGRGDAELYSGYGGPLAGTGSSTIETDISSRSAAVGGRMDLTRVGNVDLALTADAFAVNTVSDAVAGLRAATGEARRVRMMVNGSAAWSVTPDTRMDLSLALGGRLDGGEAETGMGTELAGALSLSDRRIGLDLEIRSHWLLAHQDRDFREGGLSLALRLDPGSDRKGLALTLEPSWGNNAGAVGDGLWKGERMAAYRNGINGQEKLDCRPNRTRAALGYGMETRAGNGRLEPFIELDMEDLAVHRLGGGLRLNVPGSSNVSAGALTRNLKLELLGEYRLPRMESVIGESEAPVGARDYRVGLTLFRNF